MTEIRYERVKIDAIKPFPGNARKGNVEMLRESLRVHGQYRPLVVQESTGYILAGNHTWEAMRENGESEVDIGIIDVDDDKAKKIVLVDNRSNDVAEYDDKALADLLAEIPDLEGTGFTRLDLDAMIASLGGYGRSGSVSDIPEEPITKPGEIITLGDHRLMCGSANSVFDMQELMNDELADLVITSPPYNQGLDAFKPSGMQKENSKWVQRMSEAYEDSMPEDKYRESQTQMFLIVASHCTEMASFFYNHKIRYRNKYASSPREWIDHLADWRVRQEIIWDRSSSITLNAKMFMPQDERIYWLIRGDEFHFNDKARIKAMGTVWNITPNAEIQVSAPFPVELPQRCIAACAPENALVLDPYAGTGTTMVAAHNTGRRCYMMELNPAYCDVIVERWRELTGGTEERSVVQPDYTDQTTQLGE